MDLIDRVDLIDHGDKRRPFSAVLLRAPIDRVDWIDHGDGVERTVNEVNPVNKVIALWCS